MPLLRELWDSIFDLYSFGNNINVFGRKNQPLGNLVCTFGKQIQSSKLYVQCMAAIFTRNDLVYKDYEWTAYRSDDSKVSGPPDNTLLNRHEGYEMVYLINKFCELHKKDVIGGKKAERLIRTHLPTNIRSQIAVKDWLVNNWNAFV